MNNSEPFVSVVTPVYNGEKYLPECIESVLAQKYTNLEYIILDNCSTDGTNEIAQRYAKKDRRIAVYRNEKVVDVITNHNNAYQKIALNSKYCKLLQADDWLFPGCLKSMVRLAQKHPTVGVVGAYSLSGKRIRNDGLSYSDVVISGRNVAKQSLLGNYYLFWSPSSLLIRSDLIRNHTPFYNPKWLHADVDTMYILLQKCDFGFVHQVLTFIRDHGESLTSKITKPMNRMILSNLHLFLKHGPTCLSESEYRDQLKKKMNSYYSFLAANALEMRDSDFWKYHKNFLEKIDFSFDRRLLVKAIMGRLAYKPKQSITKITRALYKKVKND
jgi:glycosyltransferase involved in cell wall biosynthesis